LLASAIAITRNARRNRGGRGRGGRNRTYISPYQEQATFLPAPGNISLTNYLAVPPLLSTPIWRQSIVSGTPEIPTTEFGTYTISIIWIAPKRGKVGAQPTQAEELAAQSQSDEPEQRKINFY